jgi:hypothetical protein
LEKYSTEATPTRKTGDEPKPILNDNRELCRAKLLASIRHKCRYHDYHLFPVPMTRFLLLNNPQQVAPGTEQAIFISFTSRAHTGCSDEFGNL